MEQATAGTSGAPGDGESTYTTVPGRRAWPWARDRGRAGWSPPGSGWELWPRPRWTRAGQARRELSGRADRATFLADATAILATSLDPRHVAEMTASLTVPDLADGAMVFLRPDLAGRVAPVSGRNRSRDPRALSLTAVVDLDPGAAAFVKTLTGIRPPTLDDEFGPGLVLRTGQTWYVPYVSPDLETSIFPPEFESSRYRAVRGGPTLAVALPGRGQIVGAFLLYRRSRRFREDEIDLLEELGRRAGMALDNALLYSGEQESALTLQRSLLPAAPPALVGAEVAMEYRPGTAGTRVGGDLYDVIPLPDARVGLAIGDVMGRGLAAAAQMGQLRAALRALALAGHGPSTLLTGLAKTASSLDVAFATCLYAQYDPATGRLLVASAGHFPPLLIIPGRPVAYADLAPGLCFGIEDPSPYEEIAIDLPAGSAVLFFTDGLVESRRQPVDEGMERLRAVLAGERQPEPGAAVDAPWADAADRAEAAEAAGVADTGRGIPEPEPEAARPGPGTGPGGIDRRVADRRAGNRRIADRRRGNAAPPAPGTTPNTAANAATPGVTWNPRQSPADLVQRALEAMSDPVATDDDVALLVLATRARSVDLLDVHLDAGPQAAGNARRALGEALGRHGLDALADDARLLVSELVANAVRHARSDLRVGAGLDGDRLRVGVEDREGGAWPRPARPDNDDEDGRGLLIVNALAHSWGVETTEVGKLVWFDLLRGPSPAGDSDPAMEPSPAGGPSPAGHPGTGTGTDAASRGGG